MGLDIYKYRITSKDEEGSEIAFTFPEEILNPTIKNLKEKFADYIEVEDTEYVDFDKIREDNNIPKDSPIVMIDYNGDDSTVTFDINDEESKTVFMGSEPPYFTVAEEVLYGIEEDYQRKCMVDEFYTTALINRTLDDENHTNVVTTLEDFENVKALADNKDCPINNWKFVEGKHFIYFSW